MNDAARKLVEVLTPVLATLELPPLVGDEAAAAGVAELLMSTPDVSVWHGNALYYGRNGEPLELDAVAGMKHIEKLRGEPGGELSFSMRSKRGVLVNVSTAFLGVNMTTFGLGRTPLVWETLVFVGDGVPGLLEPIRYMTEAAAHLGHTAVVAAVRAELKRES